ncbi:MAG: dihydrodipicolinate synthase/N-acetylneuraminate lyase [Clostridiales bacterium]|jgi:4-hydroxy-2-oxoglutarate aldolase|nr:dihydrodipicolinate synthase/N-acetylneuraminate lyase [Clostridiales bacterium]
MSKVKIKGVIPPMITPFKENGDADYSAFVSNIEKWNDDKISGYLVLGSNSETVYLNEEEKIEFIKLTVEHAKKGRHVMAGTGAESLRETIRFTNLAAKLGADSALVLTPFYYGSQMTSEVLIKYFTTLADNSDIPILIYNVPKFTHVNIKADAVAALSTHPNIIGMKDSLGDVPQLATFKRVTPDDFNLIVGTASAWYPALALGIEAGILALANCNPNECAMVQEEFEKGNWEKAREIYQAVFPINSAVTATYAIAGLKHACDVLGYNGGFVRSPLIGVTPSDKEKIEDIIKKSLSML